MRAKHLNVGYGMRTGGYAPPVAQPGGTTRMWPGRWLPVRSAAELLSVNPDALRRRIERHAQRARDGGTEANIDGVRARKFGRHWRVQLGAAWNL